MARDKAALSSPHWLLCSALLARPFPAGAPGSHLPTGLLAANGWALDTGKESILQGGHQGEGSGTLKFWDAVAEGSPAP